MTFNFDEYVKSGRAAEVANIGVARAVAESKALGLPTHGPVANDNAAPSIRGHASGLSASARGIVSQVMHRHLEAEAAKAGVKLRASAARIKPAASVPPEVLNAASKKGYTRAA